MYPIKTGHPHMHYMVFNTSMAGGGGHNDISLRQLAAFVARAKDTYHHAAPPAAAFVARALPVQPNVVVLRSMVTSIIHKAGVNLLLF